MVLDHDDDGLHTVTGDATSVRSVLADTRACRRSRPRRTRGPPFASTLALAVSSTPLAVGRGRRGRRRAPRRGAVGGAVLLLPDDEQRTAGTTSATSSGTEGSSTQGSSTRSSSTGGRRTRRSTPPRRHVGDVELRGDRPLLGTLTDLERTMTFDADGRLTTTYDDARPKGPARAGSSTARWSTT
ncbi:hypothetical protein [Janibacter melonis]|uniref:hypothetical protein n=1 Tax=Janibacter melonis TaxID=262209 RepID=UPI00209626A4|nr:hypothetical protein [Janibacter melonis]